MDSNQSGAVGGIILGVFPGSLTHLGTSRRLRGQKYIIAILTFFVEMVMFGLDFEFWNLIRICVRTCYFGKQKSTLGSVVPLAMF